MDEGREEGSGIAVIFSSGGVLFRIYFRSLWVLGLELRERKDDIGK